MDESSSSATTEKDKAARTHFKIIRFIMEAGVKLGMQSIPIATACTVYHKFFHETTLDAYDPHLVAMSAIYLAGKVEEQHLRTRDIINVCHRSYLLHYLVSLKNWMNRHSWERTPIATASWALLRDSYHGDVCLRYEAQHIAVAVLYFALQCYGVDVPGDENAETPWWKVFSEDITRETIDSITSELIQLYTMDTEIP
ncbi:hypothetical protein GDO78_013025 [Eleutherodactylus coqui]|uniref:Cyclin-Q n=1 Tax=Eleutherodactylus coqui TaxID=57060 RepID=A0A8J6EZT1_ELECQ|nr:hypothetical protein GDO78_013025 [Eleutherodactylus coqui]